ncbi:MAG: trypsin-like serine protease [Actinomycetota bacterium]|nr:trypsin-like serine protease [Actinomycetota bacterium]
MGVRPPLLGVAALLAVLALGVVTTGSAGTPGSPGFAALAAAAPSRPKLRTLPAVAANLASTPAPIGGLFASSTDSEHYCTASVVDSPKQNLLLTAAHCVAGRAAALSFIPGYDRGRAPFGRWQVVAAFAAPEWLDGQDPEDDAVFLQVAPRVINGRTVQIQQLTGGYVLGSAPPNGTRVTVVGYASGKNDQPIRCVAPVYHYAGYPAFDCDGFVGGTSGSPWLTVQTGKTDVVHGVIGGLNQGGCSPNTSYSAPFGATIASLYRAAAEGTDPSSLPAPGSAGC